jgi:mannitol-1-phosphate/altronate dehydrogenase
VAFPTSMVDRIVPAVDATALALLAEQVGGHRTLPPMGDRGHLRGSPSAP